MTAPTLTAEQAAIVVAGVEAAQARHRIFCFDGPGGTGKTVTAGAMCTELQDQGFNVVPAAITGRASSRLRQSLLNYGLDLEVRTLSDICERVVDGDDGPAFIAKAGDLPDDSVVVVDEFSMVGRRYLLTKLFPAIEGSTLIGFGDHFQLPPVMDSDNGYLEQTRHRLTQVHRQAEDSGILRLARSLRDDRVSVYRKPSEEDEGDGRTSIFHFQRPDVNIVPSISLQRTIACTWTTLEAVTSPVLVAGNDLRRELNRIARQRLGVEGPVQAGETLRVERNQPELALYNGDQVRVLEVLSERTCDGETASRVMLQNGRGDELQVWLPHDPEGEVWSAEPDAVRWDWGYATTIHKSQGAEWDHVRVAVCESACSKSRSLHGRRTLYTAITRAKRQLDVFVVDYAYNRARARAVRNARAAARSRQKPRVRADNQRDRLLARRLKDL